MTYASARVSKKPLAEGAQKVNVFPGKNSVIPTLAAFASQLFAKAVPNAVRQGHWKLLPVLVYGVDPSGSVIPSVLVKRFDGKPITNLHIQFSGFATATDCYGPGGCVAIRCCGYFSSFFYSGGAVGRESVVTTADGYHPATSFIRARAGSSEQATLLVVNSVNAPVFVQYINQYVSGSTGNVAPVRTIAPSFGAVPYGEDAAGNYWASTTHYDNTGKTLGSVKLPAGFAPSATNANGNLYAVESGYSDNTCAIAEFPANRYGTLNPIRQIDCSGYFGAYYRVGSITVDNAGNIYLPITSEEADPATTTILEYAANSGSGKVTPERSIPFSGNQAGATVAGTDNAGNLYVFAGLELYEYAPGSTTGQTVLGGMQIVWATVDANGNVFVSTKTPSIEEFPAGSTVPSATIAGSNTQLSSPFTIVLPRAP